MNVLACTCVVDRRHYMNPNCVRYWQRASLASNLRNFSGRAACVSGMRRCFPCLASRLVSRSSRFLFVLLSVHFFDSTDGPHHRHRHISLSTRTLHHSPSLLVTVTDHQQQYQEQKHDCLDYGYRHDRHCQHRFRRCHDPSSTFRVTSNSSSGTTAHYSCSSCCCCCCCHHHHRHHRYDDEGESANRTTTRALRHHART